VETFSDEREVFEPPHYINTALDLVSSADLTPLVTALEADLFLLSSYEDRDKGLFHAGFELVKFRIHEPNACIYEMCRIVRTLPRPLSAIWKRAKSRTFDIGFQAGLAPSSLKTTLGVPTLKAMAGVNARFTITLYPPYAPPPAASIEH